jgi:hypothetical protein
MSFKVENLLNQEINKRRAELDRCWVLLKSCKEVIEGYNKHNWILKVIDRRLHALADRKEDSKII